MERPPRSSVCFPKCTRKSTKPPGRRSSEHKSKSDIGKSDTGATQRTNTNVSAGLEAAEAENEQLQQSANVYGHGNFQRLIFAFNIMALMVLQCHSRVFAFIAYPVEHWCKPTKRFANLSVALWKNVGIPIEEAGRYSQCFVYAYPGHGNDSLIVPCSSWDYDEKEGYGSVRSFWDLVCHRSWLLPLVDAVYMSGALFLVPVAGYLADTTGRQPVIIGAVLALVFTTTAGCIYESFGVYLITRFICSACASTIHLLSVILLFEVIPLEFRTFYIGFACSLGNILADVFFLILGQLNLSWSVRQAVVVSPTLLLLSVHSIIYESPIWLMAIGRMEDAEDVILKAARINGVQRRVAEKGMAAIRSEMGWSDISLLPMTPKAVIEPGPIRTRASAVFLSTFAIMFGFFFISASSHFLQQAVVRMVSTVLLGPCYLAMYVALNSMGRLKLLMALTALLGGVSSLCAIAIYARPVAVSYMLVVIAKALASVLIPINYLYISELFPTAVRSAVLCGAYTFGRVGAVLAASLGPLKFARREDLGFAVAALAAFASTWIVMKLPETSVGTVATADVEKRKDLMDLMQRSLSPMNPKRHRARSKKSLSLNET
ncbi:solute carrier family 22 member 6-like [Amblyomma americanum]